MIRVVHFLAVLFSILMTVITMDRWFESQQRMGIFLFTTVSRLVPGRTQPPIQWLSGALSLGVKRPECEADHSSPSSAEVKNAWGYTSTPPISLHGAWCYVKS
jgi:hypothetical protein